MMARRSALRVYDNYPGRAYPQGPFISVSEKKSNGTFGKDATSILIAEKAEYVAIFVDYERPGRGVIKVVGAGDPGAIRLAGHPEGKGPGTYMALEASLFFKDVGVEFDEKGKHYVKLTWDKRRREFEFELGCLAEWVKTRSA